MTASTSYVLNGALDVALAQVAGGGNRGKLSVVNLNIGLPVTITVHHQDFGAETFELPGPGDTAEIPLDRIDHYLIAAASYPATILYVETAVPSLVSSPQSFAGAGGGGATINVETIGLAGTINAQVVTVGVVAVGVPAAPLANRRTMLVQSVPTNAATIYLGGAGVTADTTASGGPQLAPGASMALEIGSAALYAIAGAVGQKLAIIEGS